MLFRELTGPASWSPHRQPHVTLSVMKREEQGKAALFAPIDLGEVPAPTPLDSPV